MTFKIDFPDGSPVAWHLTDDGAEPTPDDRYRPSVFVGVRDGNRAALDGLAGALAADPKVATVRREAWFTDLRSDERESLLRVDLERIDEIGRFVREIRTLHEPDAHAPGTFELYNADFSPQFRYCLETGTDPTPARSLRQLALTLPEPAIADRDVTALRVDGAPVDGRPAGVLDRLADTIAARDPDLLVLNTAQVVPVLYAVADRHRLDGFELGRRPGWRRLAGENTFESYGRIGHSPARYDLPGRAIIDRSNSFLWGRSGLPGVVDLVERSWKPVQEAGWASIGNVLTAIQIRTALERDVLVPGTKADPEGYKTLETLHAADRGGFTFEPEVGLHEGVSELDFASLYPNIMIEYNVSPETVRCECPREHGRVPELGYSICEERGFIADVLEPIVADRDRLKRRLRSADGPTARDRLESKAEALKWILVTCFGYQGYKNSKFGRIEAHEAINAFARDILLQAKTRLEADGWRVVHGIVDSLWVAPGAAPAPLPDLAAEIADQVGVTLEFEREYDWICFVPLRGAGGGALTKYFGKVAGEDAYKVRGIEARQRSTPAFVADAQRRYMETVDRYRAPGPVVDRLRADLDRLRDGGVPAADLVIRKRASKPLEAYTQRTHTVSALHRYRDHGIAKAPGQDVRYVVVDDDARLADRVRLPFEGTDRYDAAYYARELRRACESIVSPLGWRQEAIVRYLRGTSDAGLSAYGA